MLGRVKSWMPSGTATPNQFGTTQLVVRNASMLCLPSAKSPINALHPAPGPMPIPTVLDHFKCYAVQQVSPVVPHTVLLHDQFVGTQGTSYQAVQLCNPTEKVIVGQQPTKVLYPYAHLVCYTIQLPEKDHLVLIADQFERTTIQAKMAELLCLPSFKKLL